jgi:hypothetical protein
MQETWLIRGRRITIEDVKLIREIVAKHFSRGRRHISKEICHAWGWYQASGQTKDRACRDILLYLAKKDLVTLPAGRHDGNNTNRRVKKIDVPERIREGTVKEHLPITLKMLSGVKEFNFYNGIVEKYHYQGCKIIVGKSLRYMALAGDEPVACLGWGSAAWSMDSRDEWIGWKKAVKDKNLDGIINNIRFLILPWIRIKYLASHLLGLSAKRVPEDWKKQYGTPVHVLETFVEETRFRGTCYKAANWTYLGRTKGSTKRGSRHEYHGNIKKVYVYPVSHNFREELMKD